MGSDPFCATTGCFAVLSCDATITTATTIAVMAAIPSRIQMPRTPFFWTSAIMPVVVDGSLARRIECGDCGSVEAGTDRVPGIIVCAYGDFGVAATGPIDT